MYSTTVLRFNLLTKKYKWRKKFTHRERETICDFENTTNIQPKKLPCNKRRRELLAVLYYLQNNLYQVQKINRSF